MITFEAVRRKILIIDDTRDVLQMISLALKDKGYDVITANTGCEGLEKVKSNRPELILLDLNLPDVNGKEILSRIRKIDQNIETIVITGYGGERVAIDLMKAGAADFIPKPFDIETLFDSVSDVLALRDARIEDKRQGRLSSIENFFPFLAHELRNPLHAISGALAILRRRVDTKDDIQSRAIAIINEEVEQLTGFVQDCLDFVRHPGTGYFVEGQVNEMIPIVMDIASYIFKDVSKVRVVYRLDPQLPTAHLNYEEMKQVFLNIVRNSYESMPQGGELRVETRVNVQPEGRSIVILFRDQGSGIRREDMSHLFAPFFTTKPRGSGLGLAICRRIVVERHQGRIDIESEKGVGTTVTIELPVRSLGESVS